MREKRRRAGGREGSRAASILATKRGARSWTPRAILSLFLMRPLSSMIRYTMQILIENLRTRVRYKTPGHDLTSTLIARDDLHRAPLIVSAKALSA